MPSADQVPIESPHSKMHGGKWVVLIAGSTGSALRAVGPPNRYVTPGSSARSRLRRECGGLLEAFVSGHHGPSHPGKFIGKRDGSDLGGSPGRRAAAGGCVLPTRSLI